MEKKIWKLTRSQKTQAQMLCLIINYIQCQVELINSLKEIIYIFLNIIYYKYYFNLIKLIIYLKFYKLYNFNFIEYKF